MAATGRDIGTFVSGVVLAGLVPIYLIPDLALGPVLAVASQSVGGLPLEHVGVVALVALLGAAWVDTGRNGHARVDAERWDQ